MNIPFDLELFDQLGPAERRVALRAMQKLVQGHRDNPLWRFDPLDPRGTGIPHMPQHRFMQSWKMMGATEVERMVKWRLFIGGNRSGKTTAGDVLDIIDCCDREAVPPHLQRYKRWDAPIKMYLVAVSERAVEQIHLPVFREWCPKSQLVGGSVDKALNKEFKTLHFKNGSTIQFLTQKMDVEVFQGTSLHRVHFDEEPLYDHGRAIYGECMQRLVDHNGDVLFTFTPLNGMTWVYDDLFMPWAEQQPDREAASEGFASITFGGFDFPLYLTTVDQDDNPTLDPEGKAAALSMAATDEELRARKSGKFVSFSGRIYDDFARSRHVVPDEAVLERMLSGKAQMTLGGLDPGFRHMAAGLWVTLDADGVWVFPELAVQRTIIADVAREIEVTRLQHGIPPCLWIADPAIARTDHQTGKTDLTAYHEAGILARTGNNDVRAGINAIRSLLAQDRLHIGAGCETLIEQMIRYRWKNTGRSEDAAPERPVKRDDHLLDALRYAVMALPIPEAAAPPDNRTRLQRILAADIAGSRRPPRSQPERVGVRTGSASSLRFPT